MSIYHRVKYLQERRVFVCLCFSCYVTISSSKRRLLLHGSIPETPTFIGYGVSLNYYLVEHKIYNAQKQVFTVF